MRSYWLRIIGGAFAIFAVGMVLITVARTVIAKARTVARSSEPITIPLAFVPFRLDGDQLGTFDQAVLIRKSPKKVSEVKLAVKLADSSSAARLADCDLLAGTGPNRHDHGAVFADADFKCVDGDSAATHGAERFGEVRFEPMNLVRPLYVPADVAHDLRNNASGDRADALADSIGAAAQAMGDSIAEAAARMGDSLSRVNHRHADSISRAVRHQVDSVRARARHLRDSLRAARSSP